MRMFADSGGCRFRDGLKCMHDGRTDSPPPGFYSSVGKHGDSSLKVLLGHVLRAGDQSDEGRMVFTGRVQFTNGEGTFDPVSPVEPSAVRKERHIYTFILLVIDRKHAAPVQRQRFHLLPPQIPKHDCSERFIQNAIHL